MIDIRDEVCQCSYLLFYVAILYCNFYSITARCSTSRLKTGERFRERNLNLKSMELKKYDYGTSFKTICFTRFMLVIVKTVNTKTMYLIFIIKTVYKKSM